MTNTERYPGDDEDVQVRLNKLIDDLAWATGELAEAVALLRSMPSIPGRPFRARVRTFLAKYTTGGEG